MTREAKRSDQGDKGSGRTRTGGATQDILRYGLEGRGEDGWIMGTAEMVTIFFHIAIG